MKNLILITGCARSGTSMTAGIINICGAFGGDMFGPNMYNQKGMFENRVLREELVKPYLTKIGVDPLGQKPLPNNRQVFEVSQLEANKWREEVMSAIRKQGYENGPWFYKSAKSCLFWYLWNLACPDIKWVIVRRDPQGIISSCLRTRFMRAYRDVAGWQKWVDAHIRRFEEMKAAKLNVFEYWPEKAINGDFSHAKDMVSHLGLEWKEDLIHAFIDPSLYGNH